jgi:hypothetical protein
VDEAEKSAILAAQRFERHMIRRGEAREIIFAISWGLCLFVASGEYWALYVPDHEPVWMLVYYVLMFASAYCAYRWRTERKARREVTSHILREHYQLLSKELDRE